MLFTRRVGPALGWRLDWLPQHPHPHPRHLSLSQLRVSVTKLGCKWRELCRMDAAGEVLNCLDKENFICKLRCWLHQEYWSWFCSKVRICKDFPWSFRTKICWTLSVSELLSSYKYFLVIQIAPCPLLWHFHEKLLLKDCENNKNSRPNSMSSALFIRLIDSLVCLKTVNQDISSRAITPLLVLVFCRITFAVLVNAFAIDLCSAELTSLLKD